MKRRRNPGSSMGSLVTLGAVAVGGYFLYETFFATPATAAATPVAVPATVAPVSTTVTTGGPVPVTVQAPLAPGRSLNSIYSNVIAGASTDPNFTGAGDSLTSSGYRWNVYLGLSLPAGKTIPNVPGFDLSQNMTALQYWAVMGPALTQAYGLSGFFAGLGAYARMRGMGDAASDAFAASFAAAGGGVNVNVDAATNPAFGGDYPIGPVLQDSLTVSPSTAGTGYNIDPTTGKVLSTTPPSTTSATTYMLLAAGALF